MMQLDRLTLGRMAKELGFVRDTLEKVCRLADAEGRYCPELIFGATAECANVEKHPMALWKCRDKGK